MADATTFDLSQVHQDTNGNVYTGDGATVNKDSLSAQGYALAKDYAAKNPHPEAVRTPAAARVDPATIGQDPASKATSGEGSFQDYRASTDLSPDELSKINDTYTQRARDMTALIDADYATRTANQVKTNESEIARTRVLNAKTGNTDSGTGSAAIGATETKGKAAVDALSKEHEAAVQTALGQVDQLKSAQVHEDTVKKQNDLVAYNNIRSANATKAEATLDSLAKAGADLEKLKEDKTNPNDPNEPSSYDSLAKALGLSPMALELKYNAMKKTDQQVKYTFKTSGDNIFGYGLDPATGTVKTIEENVPGLGTGKYTLKETKDGTLYKMDEQGNVSVVHAAGGTGGNSSAFTKFTGSQVSKLTGYGFDQGSITKLESFLKTGTVDDAIAKIKAANPKFSDAMATELKQVLTSDKKVTNATSSTDFQY